MLSDILIRALSLRPLTLEDLRRAEAAASDLDDPGVMDSAWR